MCVLRRPLACLALLLLTAPAWPDITTTPAPGMSPANVVLRFHNGSVVQPAVLLDTVEMETKLGKLTIPAAEVRRIDFGFRLADEDARKVEQAIRDLSSPRFPLRDAATKRLTALNRLAYPALLEARKSGDLETVKRVETILKDIRARVPADRLKTRRTDIVRTSDSVVAGQITSPALRVRCDLFGDIKIPVVRLRELRSLLPGGEVNVAVDASKYGNKTSWLETEFEVAMGTRLEITATGEINLDPGNTIGNMFTRGIRADGTPRLTSGEGFQPGQLIGRIGTEGPAFVVGSRYIGAPDREGKLYLRIVTIEHANNIRSSGAYQVRITAEPE